MAPFRLKIHQGFLSFDSMLVIIGADEYGDKDVLGIMDGFRENADSWRDLLRSLKKRGLTIAPDLACGDGALGFWTVLRDVYPALLHKSGEGHSSPFPRRT